MTGHVSPRHTGLDALMRDQAWFPATGVIEKRVLAPLRRSGLSPADIGLSVEESEQPQSNGRPALRISFGSGAHHHIEYLDWRGRLAWARTHLSLERNIVRECARSRWIMAMVKEGVDPSTAALSRRTVDPLLRAWTDRGHLSLDALVANGESDAGRYRIGMSRPFAGCTRFWSGYSAVLIDGLPDMDIEVDNDRVDLRHMRLSGKAWYEHAAGKAPTLSIRGVRLPATAMHALSGQPLRALVDVPHIDVGAMPVIDRMKSPAGRALTAVLQIDGDDFPVCIDADHA